MRNSVFFSVAVHGLVVAIALASLPAPEELPTVETRALPVDIITVDELTNLKRLPKVEKPPVDEPEPPKEIERPKADAPPTPPPPAPPPPPEQEPEPLPEKIVEKKEPPKPVEKKVEKPAPPKPPERKFDPTQIAALLNKAPEAAAKPQPAPKVEESVTADYTDDPTMQISLSEKDAVRQAVSRCYNVGDLVGGADADKLFATVRANFNQDGSVVGRPQVVRSGGGAGSRVLAERAVGAVLQCAPYAFLPLNKYQNWREMNLNFNLSGMM